MNITDDLFKREKPELSKEDEMEFLKHDIVLLAEEYLEVRLQPWQKSYLRMCQKENKALLASRRHSKYLY